MTTGNHTILVVDDEEGLRDSIAFDFRRKKFNVLTAACGNDAIKILQGDTKIDVVLSDIRMPNGTGIELLEWIKAKDVFMPVVIFITAFADLTVAQAYDRGADAVFAKPFDRKALFEVVTQAIPSAENRFRRRGTRVNTELPLGIKVPKTGANLACEVKNLGRGGIFVTGAGPWPAAGDEVEFNLTLPSGGKVVGTGQVKWVREEANAEGPAGCGIEFSDLSETSREQILLLLNQLKTKSYIPLK